MAALFRMTQLIACGEDVDVQSTVGHYELTQHLLHCSMMIVACE